DPQPAVPDRGQRRAARKHGHVQAGDGSEPGGEDPPDPPAADDPKAIGSLLSARGPGAEGRGRPPPGPGTRPATPRPAIPGSARSRAGAVPRSFWLDQPDAPDPLPALAGAVTADLAVIGGGFTGLWTALLARERYPELDVVLVEAKTAGWAASGRNGGFCAA